MLCIGLKYFLRVLTKKKKNPLDVENVVRTRRGWTIGGRLKHHKDTKGLYINHNTDEQEKLIKNRPNMHINKHPFYFFAYPFLAVAKLSQYVTCKSERSPLPFQNVSQKK